MKKENRWYKRLKMLAGVFALMAVLTAGLSMEAFTIVSLADSAGRITATSAKIRKSPSTSSDTLASAAQGNTVSVKGQIKGSDGMTWYQVVVNGTNTGYIRSDLMEITDGSTPVTLSESDVSQTATGTSTDASTSGGTADGVTAVEPVSAKASVSSTTGVRVRQKASATSQIISTVQDGHALTVIGTATGTDGKEWYQVTFTSNGSEVNGFIRSDYVIVDGELVPAGTSTEQTQQPEQSDTQQVGEEENKSESQGGWEAYYQDEKWHLKDKSTGLTYDIENIFQTVQANNESIQKVMNTNRILQIVAVCLGILSAILLSIVSVVLFKWKEVKDEAYYAEVERDTIRKRTVDRQGQRTQNGQRPAQGEGASRQQAGGNGGQRSNGGAGQRPVSGGNGQRQASGGNGQRPAASRGGSGQRQASAKGANGQQHAASQSGNNQRPVGQKNRQTVPTEHVVKQRPVEVQEAEYVSEEYSDAQAQRRQQPVSGGAVRQAPGKAKRKPRNFVDDGELEYQFLDWDEDQE